MQLSHETIYRSLFIQTRGALKKELMAHLRSRRQMRQAKGGVTKNGLGQIADVLSIRERPAEAEDRAVPGHWEGNLLCGSNHSHIVTLVERASRFVMLLKLPSRDTATVVDALTKNIRKLPDRLRRSLSWDRGKEMAAHRAFTIATHVQVYFCDPRSPWQRGSTKIPTGNYGNTSQKEPIYRSSPKPTSTRSHCGSINARERPWPSRLQPID